MNNLNDSTKRTSARPTESSSITLDSTVATQKIVEQMIPTVTQDNANEEPKRVSMVSGKTIIEQKQSNREVADIAELVQQTGGFQTEEDEEKSEIEDKVSLEKEILGPGGPFEQWKKDEIAEAKRWVAMQNQKAADEYDRKAQEDAMREEGVEFGEDKEEKEIMAEQGEVRDNAVVKHTEIERDTTDETHNGSKEKKEVPFYEAMRQQGIPVNVPQSDDLSDLVIPNDDELNYDEKSEDGESSENDTTATVDHENPKVEKMVTHTTKNELNSSTTEDTDGVYETSRDIHNSTVSYSVNVDKFDKEEEDIEKAEESISDDQRLEELRTEITDKLKEKSKKLNLEGFTVASKATASNVIFEVSEVSAAKWPLPNTNICVEMKALPGQKVEELRLNVERPNNTTLRNRLRILYDAITTPKPQSFEVWLRSISYADYDHLFMPAYIAAFNGANYMPNTCDKERNGCGKMFLSEDISIMKCVKFTSEETKAKFWELYDSDRTNSDGLYVTEIVPVSNTFAIAFRDPSLYSVLFEYSNLNREFVQKYSDTLQLMPYIDNIYWIDQVNKKLVRLDWGSDPNNAVKTTKRKVMKYHNVFGSLSTDEYSNVGAMIGAIRTRSEWLTYQIPEMTCPECGRVIPATESTASSLVFTRHQLGLLANTSIK